MTSSVVWAFLVAVGMIAQQLAGKAIRDAFFLTHYDAQTLPAVMTASAAISLGMVLSVSTLYRSLGPHRVVPLLYWGSAAFFGAEWALAGPAPKAASVLLYVHTSSLGAVAISGFWSVINEAFDPHTLKRVVGRIASGASAGGVLGGLLTWQGARFVSLTDMLLVLVVVNVACGIGLVRLGASTPGAPPTTAAQITAVEVFEKTPYLRHVAGLVVLLAVASAGYDYAFKATASEALADGQGLVSFFAVFYSGLGIATFLVQSLATSRLLRTVGLTWAVATLPVSIIAFGALALLNASLWTYTLLRGLAAVAESSLYRSGYELLYTPLTPDKKRPTKSLIDVGGDKLGVAAGSALGVFVVGLLPGQATLLLTLFAIVCAMGALALTRRLYRGYLAALTDSLEKGAVRAEEVDLVDRGTAQAVERTVALSRTSVTSAATDLEIQARDGPACRLPWQEARAPSEDVPASWSPPDPVVELAGRVRDPKLDLVALTALDTRERPAVVWALRHHAPLPPHLVPAVLELIDDPEHGADAVAALQHVAPAHVGQLGDLLLDLNRRLPQRATIPGILAQVPTRRSVEVLWHGTGSRPIDVRVRAAFALAEQARVKAPGLDPEIVFDRIREELRRYPPTASSLARRRQVLAYAVQLLTTVVDREPLMLAVRAVAADDGRTSGTGREYLDNVVPEDVAESLVVLLRHRSADRVLAASDASEVLRMEPPVNTLGRVWERLAQWHPKWAA